METLVCPLPAGERELARLDRLVRVCTAAALAAETSLKALAVVRQTDADRLAEAYAVMAPEIADVLAEHLQYRIAPDDPELAPAVARRQRLAARIAAQDVRRGVAATPGIDIWRLSSGGRFPACGTETCA